MIALEAWSKDIFIGKLRLTVLNNQIRYFVRVNRDKEIVKD
jgi:hypothetical protein